MTMRATKPMLLVGILLFQALLVLAVDDVTATSGRGGSSDDYSVNTITIENATAVREWVQPDGSIVEYIAKGDSVEVSVEVKRGGSALSGAPATVTVDVVHPIGFVMNTTSWETTPLLGGQSYTDSFTWTATVSHSVLDVNTNELSGGIIIRAHVLNTADDRNENDIMQHSVPVAFAQDDMDAEGDPRDQSLPTAAIPTFYGGEYPSAGGDATGLGIWQEDASTSTDGVASWRHANDGSDYPSASHSRLIMAYRSSSQACDVGTSLDGGLSQVYYQYMCRISLISAGMVSVQMHAQTWGSMGAGDYVAFELWRGNGAPSMTLAHNFSEHSPGVGAEQWTNVSWDPTDHLGGHTWNFGLLFHSDGSGASSGMHVDDFIVFGIEKVSEYTLNISCDNPIGGYTTPPNNVLPMHCMVTNNGYSPASVRIQSNVSNLTWMDPSLPMIRIDSDNPTQHGTNVIIPPIPGGNTSEMWINISIPAGADVQQQVWQVWWSDAGGTNLGELGRVSADLAITEQYGVYLSSPVPLLAASLTPGQTTDIPFKLQNSGNREAGFSIISNFQADDWTAFVTDLNHSIVQMPMPLGKGEQVELLLNVTAPSDASPGEVPFTLRAVCPSCGQSLFGTEVISKKIEVPVLRELQIVAEEYEISAPANGQSRVVIIDLLNLGNDDEAYSLSLTQSNWKLGAYLAADETPVLDAWDGETSIVLNLPMPVGLAPGLYTARIDVTSLDDPSVMEQVTISIDVTDTAAVWVSDEEADQSYIPGDDSQSMRFEVRNDGNKADRFEMSLIIPEGMTAGFDQLVDGTMTPVLDPGESYNVTVTFSFDEGASGQKLLQVVATSESDSTVSSTGMCTYNVGTQNWLRIISTENIIISEGGEYEVVVRVRNMFNEGQSVSMSVDQGGTNKWYRAKIDSSDRDFWLDKEGEREVTIKFEVEESSLINLEEDFIETQVKIWATSNSVEEAASLDLSVNLKKMSTGDDVEGSADGSSSIDWVLILTWVVGGAIIIALLGSLIMILNNSEEEEEQVWVGDGYEDLLSATYGSVAAAPTIGDSGVIQSPPAVPADSPPSVPAPAPEPVQNQGPPIPSGGLPEGWTMEQWQHYGQQWLDNQG